MLRKLWNLFLSWFGNTKQSQKTLPAKFKISGMSADAVAERLLRASYLPRQRTNFDEFPPVFDSTTLSLSVAKKFQGLAETNPKYGHDAVTATSTRADGHQRQVAIPHPAAYTKLVLTLHKHWERVYPLCQSQFSYVKPRPHPDGRLIIMNYQNWLVKSLGGLKRRISNQFIVHADIANFFPSVYTHSIAWALVGIKTAKASNKKEWFDEIDQAFQAAKRKETNGIAIGPATSNIATEIILKKVDDNLIRKGFNFYRYIDDFTCFTKTKSEAERFVNELRTELDKYKLVLNAKKTKILPLPRHNHDDWLYQVKQSAKLLPHRPKPSQVVDFIESLVEIENRCNDKSVFKYGFAILGNTKLSTYSRQAAFVGCMSLCFQVPNLHSMLRYFKISKAAFAELELRSGLTDLLSEAVANRQSDSMCWYLYYCRFYEVEILDEIASSIIKTRDCLSLLLLYCYASPKAKNEVVKFAKRAISTTDPHDRHQYWLLTFELYRRGAINAVGNDKQQFDMMITENVHFCTA